MKPFLTLILISLSFQLKSQNWDVIFKSEFDPFKKNAFISGHSLMDNPYPDHLQMIAESLNTEYNWNQQNGIGSPIRVRTSGHQLPPNDWLGYHTGKNRDSFDMDVIAELQSPATIGTNEIYDALLITERHDILDVIRWEHTNSLLRHYHDRLRAGNPEAETYLYHSWLDIDPADPQDWIGFETDMLEAWECVASKVNLTLEADGHKQAINVIPAGWALANLLSRILNDEVPGFTGTDAEKVDALFNDNVHLNIEGIYYMAAVSFAIVERRSPQSAAHPAEISSATASSLQAIAWENAQQYLANYQVPSMSSCRQSLVDNLCSRYFEFTDRPEQVSSCQDWMNNSSFSYNPFNWPDPDLVVWPDP